MATIDDPDAIYDEIIETPTTIRKGQQILPITEDTISLILEHSGSKTIELTTPQGNEQTITGRGEVPETRERLIDLLYKAQKDFKYNGFITLDNLSDPRLGPLHFSNSIARFAVKDDIFNARGQRGTDELPNHFKHVAVKAAHTAEGLRIANELPHHWAKEAGWGTTMREELSRITGENPEEQELDIDPENCWIINVPIEFPAQRFGQVTNVPSRIVMSAIRQTEMTLKETLMSKEIAQLKGIEEAIASLEINIAQGKIHPNDLNETDNDQIMAKTLNKTGDNPIKKIKNKKQDERRKAFQTVRRLSNDENFNIVMAEYAETISDLGLLAMAGTKYREEQGKPPGFY